MILDIDVIGVMVIIRVLVYILIGIDLFCVVFVGILNYVMKIFEDGNVFYKKRILMLVV